MWKVCEREKYGYHSLGYVVPRPLLTPQSINCSSSQWSVESNSAEANVLLAKHSVARRRRKSVAAMSTWSKCRTKQRVMPPRPRWVPSSTWIPLAVPQLDPDDNELKGSQSGHDNYGSKVFCKDTLVFVYLGLLWYHSHIYWDSID